MSPQAKAVELLKKINDKIVSFENVRLRGEGFEMSKQCALITVNEILEETKEHVLPMGGAKGYDYDDFWLEVKAEIEKL